jgi:hypothetical protein
MTRIACPRSLQGKTILVVVALLMPLGCGHSSDRVGARPVLPVDRVLASPGFAAQQWPHERWELYNTVTVPLSKGENRSRRWTTENRSATLDQAIHRLANDGAAHATFRQEDPRSYDEDFPLRIDASSRYHSVSAEESRVYCLAPDGSKWSIEQCNAWTYWARYGQYVLRLDYTAGLGPAGSDTFVLRSGISATKFLDYVTAFDKQVSGILQLPSPTSS